MNGELLYTLHGVGSRLELYADKVIIKRSTSENRIYTNQISRILVNSGSAWTKGYIQFILSGENDKVSQEANKVTFLRKDTLLVNKMVTKIDELRLGNAQRQIQPVNSSVDERQSAIPVTSHKIKTDLPSEEKQDTSQKPRAWLYALGIFFIPFITFFIILVQKPFAKKVNIVLLTLCVIWSIPLLLSARDDSYTDPSPPTSSIGDETPPNEDTQSIAIKVLDDSVVFANLFEACEQIGLDLHTVDEIQYVGDWVSGAIYRLSYRGANVEIYMNSDNTVNSINVGRTHVYKQGLEPLNIIDYLVTLEERAQLELRAEETVKDVLNYPSTAKFHRFKWGYGRVVEIYTISGMVTAQNALGVESDMKFYIEFKNTGNLLAATPKFFVLNGVNIIGNGSVIEQPERESVPIDIGDAPDGSFMLIDGFLGEFGEEREEDGYTFIAYYIPAGSYTVTTDDNFCVVYVEKENADIVSINRFTKDVRSIDIKVREGERITLTSDARVTFTPKD